jgi:hypothetical protein
MNKIKTISIEHIFRSSVRELGLTISRHKYNLLATNLLKLINDNSLEKKNDTIWLEKLRLILLL